MNRILCLLLTALVLFQLPLIAEAADLPDDCSIEVVVKYNGKYIDDGELTAVRVGYVDRSEAVFKRITDHKTVTDIGKQKAVSAMIEYYNDNKSKLDTMTVDVSEGIALFEDIPTGLYLIYQHDAADGYNNLAPFLVTVPYTVDGEPVYDVTVSAKPELKREPKKPTTPSRVTVTKLPQTGQLTWPVPVLAISGMSLFVLGWWLCFGRRKDSYET